MLVIVEAVARLLPGVLGNEQSHQEDSFSSDSAVGGLLEGPSYTRPVSWRGLDVPAVLLSGDHAKVAAWRREQSLRRTGNAAQTCCLDLRVGVRCSRAFRGSVVDSTTQRRIAQL